MQIQNLSLNEIYYHQYYTLKNRSYSYTKQEIVENNKPVLLWNAINDADIYIVMILDSAKSKIIMELTTKQNFLSIEHSLISNRTYT
jgi:hypothetical protein